MHIIHGNAAHGSDDEKKAAEAAESVKRKMRGEETMEEEINKIKQEEEEDEIFERQWWGRQARKVTEDDYEIPSYESESKAKKGRTFESQTSSDENEDSEVKFQRSVMKACDEAEDRRREKESE